MGRFVFKAFWALWLRASPDDLVTHVCDSDRTWRRNVTTLTILEC